MTASENMEPLAVSASKAAELLGVSRSKVYELLKRDDFPSFSVGGRTLISVAGLREWVDQQTRRREVIDHV